MKHLKYFFISSVAFFSLSSSLHADVSKTLKKEPNTSAVQQPKKLKSPIIEALEAGYKNNPELQSMQAQLRSSDEKVPQALAAWRPQINGSYGLSRNKQIYYDGFPAYYDAPNTKGSVRNTRQQGSVEISQNIFNGFGMVASVKEAENSAFAQHLSYFSKEQEFLLKIINIYTELCALHETINVQRLNEKMLEEFVRLNTARRREGDISTEDLSQAEAQLMGAKAQREAAEREFDGKKESFRKLTGLEFSYGDLSVIAQLLPSIPKSLEAIIEHSYKNSFILQAAEKELIALKASLTKINSGFMPTVDASVNISKSRSKNAKGAPYLDSYSNSKDNIFATEAGVRVRVPIYGGGVTCSQRREVLEKLSSKRLSIANQKNEIREQVSQSYQQVVLHRESIGYFTNQVKSLATVVQGKKAEFEAGSGIMLDVLQNLQKHVQAQLELLKSRQKYIVSQCQLLFYMGNLTAKHLKLNVPYYDPMQHFNSVRNRWF